ncbi:hypothetical protein M8853_07570 [Pasteurella multocida]|uniref:hypothetical protein n=1 Tax=Pasteurella multocida TaxID=747 RepID=UPI0007EDDA45|nr:hypothetical protein [Pasteurella multocida]MCL7825605.1 hypothetical protein [Pasteurella multocida]MCL7839865.1 hypothetical protein [Pasteurella multocida]OBP36067.1 hypothetical protein A0R69_00165 [Pasteurella multocida subsp. multocida]PNM11009.1 hypothetical protein A6J59_010245 [Pasteurella multocida]URH91422.1 hypothetical protein M8853_07570 [Pasteurella multocida]
MKKASTAKALMLGLGIAVNGHSEPSLINNISHSVEEIRIMTSAKATAQDVFREVDALAQSLHKLNILIKTRLTHIDPNNRASLLLVNQALDFGISLIKTRYENEIYEQFFNEFKALASAKNTLEIYLRRIQEQRDGIEIVRDPQLTLTKSDIEKMMSARG